MRRLTPLRNLPSTATRVRRIALLPGVLLAATVGLLATACSDTIAPIDGFLGGWEVQSIGDEPVLVSAIPSFFLGYENEIGGNLSCNTFGGTILYSGADVDISQVFHTEMYCSPEPVMEQERAFLDALNRVTRLDRDGRELVFLDAGGEVLLRALATVDAD